MIRESDMKLLVVAFCLLLCTASRKLDSRQDGGLNIAKNEDIERNPHAFGRGIQEVLRGVHQ